MIPEYEAVNGRTAYVMYKQAMNIKPTTGSVEATLEETYFDRTPDHFCSRPAHAEQPRRETEPERY